MSQKVNPFVAIGITVVALVAVIFLGVKVMRGSNTNEGGSEGKAVIVKPNDPNNPGFTRHLPAGFTTNGGQ